MDSEEYKLTPKGRAIMKSIEEIMDALYCAVKVAGPEGVPAGILYAAVMDKMSLEHFQVFMAALVQRGKVRAEGNLFYACEPPEEA